MKIAGVVPAKGSSSRVEGKNLQEVLGVPLFLWAANNLRRVLPPGAIWVDSEDPRVLERAQSAGFQVLERPAELATNATDGNGLMRFEASRIEAEVLVQHLPPMPFLREATLRRAVGMMEEGYDSVFGGRREALYLWDEEGPRYDLRRIPNSVDLPRLCVEGMGLYVTRREALLESGLRVSGRWGMVGLDRLEAIDVDYPEDLAFVRTIARGLEPGSPYLEGIETLRGGEGSP